MSTVSTSRQQLDDFQRDFHALREELGKVVVGQAETIDGVLTAAIAGGHVLLEGPPGLGKTLLVSTLAEIIDLSFQRIQFTPDLMPSDLIGTYVVMENPQGRRIFEFQQGPLFANLILADQINRGMPRTQSALLQAMEGETISVARENLKLPQPFFVMATQNPLEMEGTFPLPEPEIDRFFVKLAIRPPDDGQVEQILDAPPRASRRKSAWCSTGRVCWRCAGSPASSPCPLSCAAWRSAGRWRRTRTTPGRRADQAAGALRGQPARAGPGAGGQNPRRSRRP